MMLTTMLEIILLLFGMPGDEGRWMAEAPSKSERGVRHSEMVDPNGRIFDVCPRRDGRGRRVVVERLDEVEVDYGGRNGHRRALVLPRVGDVDLGGTGL